MPSITLKDLMGAYDLSESGADNTGLRDASLQINGLLAMISSTTTYGIVTARPGIYRMDTPMQVPANITIEGFGYTVFKLGNSSNVDVIQLNNVSNVRLRNIQIDGNRANNSSGNGIGIYMNNVTDAWLDNVEVVSAVADGIQLNQCVRVELNGVRASDNGRHGVSLNGTTFSLFQAVRSFNNCAVSTSGTADGFNLDVISTDNSFIGCLAYDTALTGSRQGYGFQEVSGALCARNVWIGPTPQGNATGAFLMEPDSLAICAGYVLGNLGLGTASPNASAVLDLVSTRTGLGINTMTTVQKTGITSPRAGLTVYDSTLNKLSVYTGSAWEAVTSG